MDASLRAMEYRLALENRPSARQQVKSLRRQINAECGGIRRWIGATAAPILFGANVLEQLRVARGWTYEPKERIERRNWGTAPIVRWSENGRRH
jgi:hypothetical protein